VNELAARIVRLSTCQEQEPVDTRKPRATVGASKGGASRAAKLSPADRKKIAKKAAQARWSKKGS
jgi:hypothetical protein